MVKFALAGIENLFALSLLTSKAKKGNVHARASRGKHEIELEKDDLRGTDMV